MASTSSTLMPKMKRFSPPASSAISTLAPSMVPMVRAPFSMNFMLPVPDASVPAVEICSDRSAAGMAEREDEKQRDWWGEDEKQKAGERERERERVYRCVCVLC